MIKANWTLQVMLKCTDKIQKHISVIPFKAMEGSPKYTDKYNQSLRACTRQLGMEKGVLRKPADEKWLNSLYLNAPHCCQAKKRC